ncbi:TPA: sulfur carrier protein ThiS [Candidatus Galligastranaerophilus intestinavium]|uniref:Sulfur carrier protein ThiS n=1 Tax=Candidatus Galligastranaerophilus intestinavium TaxID=2840836 RepID=A0A9D1FKB8_9BACT|nr:sulfur carrier protein ThiS [Candidatus Galligastranaerophilus intestinavium]
MAQIILNGVKKDISDNISLSELLSDMDLPRFFVVEKNMQIVYRENFDNEFLKDGDSIEIATFCGGG